MTRKLNLRIDRLILDGVAFDDRAAFEQALKAQIAAALAQGEPKGLASAQRLDAGTAPTDPAALGRQVADRILRGGT